MIKLTALAVLTLVTLAGSAHAGQSPAERLSQAEQSYCHAYAENEYQAAVTRKDAFPDASYEGATEECELQWLIVETEWAAR